VTTQQPEKQDGWINDAAMHLDDHVDVTAVVDELAPRLRATVRHGVPLVTDDPGIEINTRALRQILAHAIRRASERELTAIDIVTEHKSIKQVRLDLIARYGDRIDEVSTRVRTAVRAELATLRIAAHNGVDVRWVDVAAPDSESGAALM
jgi:uncharacterized alkaline shock family protein YloU